MTSSRSPERFYDVQGKPIINGCLIAFYHAGLERLVRARVFNHMTNSRVYVRMDVGGQWLPYTLKPECVVVLEEPLWPNK